MHPFCLPSLRRTCTFRSAVPLAVHQMICLSRTFKSSFSYRRSPIRAVLHMVPDAHGSYASPEAYDIAFSFRDFESEVAFLLAAQATHASRPLLRYLDVGCGPARHAILLAQATGARCIGLDASPTMIQYAARRAKEQGVSNKVDFVCADMAAPTGIAHTVPGGRVDVAGILLGTLSHCLDNEIALRCFRNLAEVIRPGGLLVAEFSHPDDLFGGSFTDASEFSEAWEAAEDGSVEFARREVLSNEEIEGEGQDMTGMGNGGDAGDVQDDEDENEDADNTPQRRVLVEYGREGDTFDPLSQILYRTVGLSLFDSEGELVSSHVSVVPQRQFTLQEIDLLARATGFEVVATYGDLDESIPLDDEDAQRMVVVLRNCSSNA